MSTLKKLLGLRKQIEDVEADLQSATQRVQSLKQQREKIHDSMPPQSDVIQLGIDYIEGRKTKQLDTFTKHGMPWFAMSRGKFNPLLESSGGGSRGDGAPNAAMLYVLLAPQLKDAFSQLVENLDVDWSQAGPPLAERPKLIAKIDSEISSLEKEIADTKGLLNRP